MSDDLCVNVMKEYLREMMAWELKWGEVMNRSVDELFSEDGNTRRKEEIENIFQKFLSKKSLASGQSRLVNLSFETPPEHDVEFLKVESKGKTKCQVYTRRKANSNEVRFDLILENGEWRIDTKAFNFMDWKTQRTVF